MKISIPVVSLSRDHGDGSGSVTVFNSHDELKAWFNEVYDEEGPEKYEIAVSGNQPYEVGTVERDKIEVEIIDGVAKLVKELSFSTGQ